MFLNQLKGILKCDWMYVSLGIEFRHTEKFMKNCVDSQLT